MVNFYAINIATATEATHITHGGVFHGDEVIATAILSALGPVALNRTFCVPENTNAFVYDIGGGQYDHHQRGGNGSRENGVPYSSAGLIWRDFGRKLVSCEQAWAFVDQELIAGIDAADNGVLPGIDYPVKPASLYGLVSGFNPSWDSKAQSDEAFLEAVAFAQGVLARAIASAESKARAKALVDAAIEASEDQIIVLPRYAPWQEYVLASENPKAADALYVVFPGSRGGYNVQAIPDAIGSYGNRKPLPESWRGVPANDLQTASGVADANFCHKGGFIGGADSLNGALAMARKAIEA
ncbi:MYG1 family protein [Candidatus Saccharibacteria bacterium]|nr:MYG1 family protein [Candidatus Saccharibacteria bacterium]